MNRARVLRVVLIGSLLCLPTAVSAEEATTCELGQSLRALLGLGPSELATMGVSAAKRSDIATAAEQFCSTNRETIEPLIEAAQNAKQQAYLAYELAAADIDTKDQAVRTALSALAGACGSLTTTVNTHLTAAQQELWSNRRSNPLMDIRYGMLELTAAQRTSIRAAQKTRDQVIRHHQKRKNPTKVQSAHANFKAAVLAVLTAAQEQEVSNLFETRWANKVSAEEFEEALCEEE